ncbi:MAG: hypothetical protein Q7W13_00575 [Bacteroidia bacterium]|nr:hypothetical protein [Bacteroidia bacterium]
MSETRILISGLPSTGKTTFIAALWNYINSDVDDKSLTLDTLAGSEHEYLNSIANDWLAYKDPSRSLQNTNFERVIMPLKKTATGEAITIEIPDVAGEKFRDHFDLREWPFEFDKLLDNLSGIVVFVNPLHKNNLPQFIADVQEIEDFFEEDNAEAKKAEDAETRPAPTLTNWDVKFVPNQVKMVEVLQLLQFHKAQNKQLKISLIVSAWDTVSGADTILPKEWMENNLPLLYQYLICNTDKYIVRFFGVSAQGCDYGDEKALDNLMNKNSHDRIVVKEDGEPIKDITQPIIWMTE